MAPTPSRAGYTQLATQDDAPRSSSPSHAPAADGTAEGSSHQAGLESLDALFSHWTSFVTEKMRVAKLKRKAKRKKKDAINSRDKSKIVEILASVFEAVAQANDDVDDSEGKGKGKAREVEDIRERTLDHLEPMSRETFDEMVDKVKEAIRRKVHPKLNVKGSSGSYFAKDVEGHTLGIFKPKDESPYGNLNPKFTKWIHREFLSRIIPFGRACLIPGNDYLSEAAASLLDRRLDAHIVPRTEVVSLSSTAFYYDYVDRGREKKGKGLPAKDGSFQVFVKDASEFLRNHPVPGRSISQPLDTSPHRHRRTKFFSSCRLLCGTSNAIEEDDDETDSQNGWGWGGEDGGYAERRRDEFVWTEEAMSSLRSQLEKLVILDFLMRNTDRGLDNFMLSYCTCTAGDSIQPHITSSPPLPKSPMSEITRPSPLVPPLPSTQPAMSGKPHFHLAAIDNSLSFPHHHPKGWRAYPFGWLYLPVSLIGQPFSEETRRHYLPLLSSPRWWEQTTLDLRKLFELDKDFKEKSFQAQMSVIKGQGWNLVQSLLDPEEGPLELCRRPRKLVKDDMMEVADDEITRSLITAAASPRPVNSILTSPPRPVSHSTTSSQSVPARSKPDLPPFSLPSRPVPLKRVSSEFLDGRRIASHSRSVSTVLSGSLGTVQAASAEALSGMSLLNHLDRVEAEERVITRRTRSTSGAEYEIGEDEEEEGASRGGEWGVRSENDIRSAQGSRSLDIERKPARKRSGSLKSLPGSATPFSPTSSKKGRPARPGHMPRGHSISEGRRSASWLSDHEEEVEDDEDEEEAKKKVVIVERLVSEDNKPFFSFF